MRVLFLVEAGGKYGLGHLMRAQVLAETLSNRGAEVMVGLRTDRDGAPDWLRGSFETAVIDDGAAAESLAAARHPDWVVVDGYELMGERIVGRLRTNGMRVIAFDDLETEGGGADLVVNQNSSSAIDGTPGRLLGPDYALVDPAYAQHRSRPLNEAMRRVLVTFGGSDLHGLTARTIAAFRDVPGSLFLDVVVGPYHRTRQFARPGEHQLVLHQEPRGLAHLLATADLVISAAGSTCWQVCCAGAPLVAVQTADNQREVVRTLAQHGCALTFGLTEFDSLVKGGGFPAVIDRFGNPSMRREMSDAQEGLVDGNGAARIASAMGF